MIFFFFFFFFSSRRRHTRLTCDWSSDVCSSDLDAFRMWERAYRLRGACTFERFAHEFDLQRGVMLNTDFSMVMATFVSTSEPSLAWQPFTSARTRTTTANETC